MNDDKQSIYCLTTNYNRAALKVRQAGMDNWDDEHFHAANEEMEAAWKELHKAVYFRGANDPAALIAAAKFDPDNGGDLHREVDRVTRQLSMLSEVINQWPSTIRDAANAVNRYPGEASSEQLAEAIEAEQIDNEVGPLSIAAGMVSAELDRRGQYPYRVCVEDPDVNSTLNPAVESLVKKQVKEALESDGLAVFVTGNPDDEDGIRVYGPYPGETTAAILHHGTKGRAIALEPVRQVEAPQLLRPTDCRINPRLCEFGWVNVYGAYDPDNHLYVDGPWIDRKTAEDLVDGEAEVVTAPILGPIQFRP